MVGSRVRPLQRVASFGAIFFGIASLVFGGAAGPARAQTTIACGTTVVSSIVLKSDLRNCSGDGLIVAADDVTIDLNGHTIEGPGTFDSDLDGIDNRAGHDGLTVVNGTLRGFGGAGVSLDAGATDTRLADLVLINDHVGVGVSNSSNTSIQTSSIAGRKVATGIAVQSSTGTLIANNTLSNTRAIEEVLVFTSSGTSIEGNRIDGGVAAAVESVLGSNNDVIGNVISGRRISQIGVSTDSPGSRIADNEIFGFGWADVFVGADRVRVVGNAVHDSVRGFMLQGSTFYGRPTGVVVRRNEAFDTHVGILIREMSDTLVARNATHDNQVGIRVKESDGTEILKNRSDHNGGDGILVRDPATTITSNRADLNGDLGIRAVEGVTDGGGNTALGNGDPAECVNVDCSTGGP